MCGVSALATVTFRPALGAHGASVTSSSCSCGAAPKPLRRGPAAAGGGAAVAAAAAPVGLPPGRARAKLPPYNGETPRNPGHIRPVIPDADSPSVARACSRSLAGPSGVARRRCALETVEKVVTTRPMALVRSPDPLASGCE